MRLALMGLTLKDQKIVGHGGNPVQWAAAPSRPKCRGALGVPCGSGQIFGSDRDSE